MGQRRELNDILKAICPNVYFQPPESVKLTYPCIVYQLTRPKIFHADNLLYQRFDAYTMTYITRDPDDPVRVTLMELPLCTLERFYAADNLNHYAYTIYH